MNKIGRTKEIIKLDNIQFKKESLSNLNIVVTGALEHFSRKTIEDVIVSLGGTSQSSINAKTSFLVIGGEHVGSKYQKAKELNIKIVDEYDFIKLISDYKEDLNTL
jgi:DNA ligase (NAD+)